jgi:hypothetical protein
VSGLSDVVVKTVTYINLYQTKFDLRPAFFCLTNPALIIFVSQNLSSYFSGLCWSVTAVCRISPEDKRSPYGYESTFFLNQCCQVKSVLVQNKHHLGEPNPY